MEEVTTMSSVTNVENHVTLCDIFIIQLTPHVNIVSILIMS